MSMRSIRGERRSTDAGVGGDFGNLCVKVQLQSEICDLPPSHLHPHSFLSFQPHISFYLRLFVNERPKQGGRG